MKSTSLSEVKGIGKVSLEKLSHAGINSKLDLIYCLPKKYQKINFFKQIKDIKPGFITVKARASNVKTRVGNRRFLKITTAELNDDSGKILATWFNQPYRENQLKTGQFYFSGQFEFMHRQYQLLNPSVQAVSAESSKRLAGDHIQPIYGTIRGLKTSFIEKTIKHLANEILILDEFLPAIVIDKLNLAPRSDALYHMHFPTREQDLLKYIQRFLVEKYFVASLASYLSYLSDIGLETPIIKVDYSIIKAFVKKLPFDLTDDQRKAIWLILEQMRKSDNLNCLLQGDVGSGKTIVALAVSMAVINQGGQVAIMAPTELLANQHHKTAQAVFASYNYRVELLTSSTKAAAKKNILKDLAAGKIDLIIGTHALIQDQVKFKQLELVVIDEQHRFGVEQRQSLIKKSILRPHFLSMTATPIPRSLALIFQNELKVISIKQKPARLLPIMNQVLTYGQRSQAYTFAKKQLAAGHQAYILCGLIEENEESDRLSLTKTFKDLQKNVFGQYKLAMLHGKMKAEEKNQIMVDFLDKKYDVLVATTVIEVGIDVPNATVMIIHDADYFGLSQLHQLRGRVGRGEHQSYCFFITSQEASSITERLNIIKQSNDGFYLAEEDLKMRGMGDVFGQAQHGRFNINHDLEAIKIAAQGLKYYQQHLSQHQLEIMDDLKNYPELLAMVEQQRHLTVLN